jgi:hypothetical protein
LGAVAKQDAHLVQIQFANSFRSFGVGNILRSRQCGFPVVFFSSTVEKRQSFLNVFDNFNFTNSFYAFGDLKRLEFTSGAVNDYHVFLSRDWLRNAGRTFGIFSPLNCFMHVCYLSSFLLNCLP